MRGGSRRLITRTKSSKFVRPGDNDDFIVDSLGRQVRVQVVDNPHTHPDQATGGGPASNARMQVDLYMRVAAENLDGVIHAPIAGPDAGIWQVIIDD